MKSRMTKLLVPAALLLGVVAPLTTAGASSLIPQTITLSTIPSMSKPFQPAMGSTWLMAATGGDSGNPVILTIDASSTSGCTISSNTVTFLLARVGTCIIDANQAGNATYAAAPQVQYTFTIPLLIENVWINTKVPTLRIGMTYQFTATDKGGGDGSGKPIVFAKGSLPSKYPASGCTITPTGLATFKAPAGYCTVLASQAGGGNYAASSQSGWSFMVHPALGTTNTVAATKIKVVTFHYGNSMALSPKFRLQLSSLAEAIRKENLKSVTVNCYFNKSGAARRDKILSTQLATNAASFLKTRLAAMKVSGVLFVITGHGATMFVVTPPTSPKNRRVEVIASK